MRLSKILKLRPKDFFRRRRKDTSKRDKALRRLAIWRSSVIETLILHEHGTEVISGPFEGMDYVRRSEFGNPVPKLLGCFEQPLQPHIERAISAAYPVVMNVGCAEGYYAVGMARRMPTARVVAFDKDSRARQACAELAAINSVADRIEIGGEIQTGDFANYAGRPVLVLCDIEGAELEILSPDGAPALRYMDMIVESHECFVPGVTRELIKRFASSHVATLVEDNGQRQLPDGLSWFNRLAHLDQLLAIWERRKGPTLWLVLKAKKVA